MKCCVSTDVGTWTNWLTFEPDPDYSPDAGTGLLSPISYALQREILLRRENLRYRYSAPVAAATRGVKMVLFTASREKQLCVGGTCAPRTECPSSSLLPQWRQHQTGCHNDASLRDGGPHDMAVYLTPADVMTAGSLGLIQRVGAHGWRTRVW